MAYSIDFVDGLNRDLEAVEAASRRAAALWVELIDLIYDSQPIADELTRSNGYRAVQPHFDSIPVGELLRRGYNISRVKLYGPDGNPHPHRLLYAVNHSTRPATIVLLGLMPRSAEYETSNQVVARAIQDYDRLGIPRVPRG